MFDDNPRARLSDPETSHEAADGNDVHGARHAVLAVLRGAGPFADFELERYYAHVTKGTTLPQYTPQRLRTARKELVDAGAVVFSGSFRQTPTGGKSRVWAVRG
jgi:hypothetical protein